MISKIKYCLNNEYGGPNLEMLIGIGVAIAAGVSLYGLARVLYEVYQSQAGYFKKLYNLCNPKILDR